MEQPLGKILLFFHLTAALLFTLRGGFGHAFRRIICALKDKECTDCLLRQQCVYAYVFETPIPADAQIMRKYTAAPHPFILEPSTNSRKSYRKGEDLSFGLTLIGRAADYLPYFIYAFEELGRIGIGKGRGVDLGWEGIFYQRDT